ncbi:retrovirus-related Pol polyprotein from type-1 retrotransposable element R2 [Trichonephila clavata]|uniref:Retrovirus-related Pol polyprotein from type-1 retrotransposable element R2 n=1 Tax=Trichonephila clavata TaxID=2740835 RepID=A0A8X6GCS6_TRICU|nr:retrovirus-related Pol polyprotein from type-1 retrotransposable element R2 [Trichonephila clavata]
MRVLTEEGPTEPILLKSGVKQGCPLSGILFNLSIDYVLQTLQDQQESRTVLAFADDLVLFSRSAQDLQYLIDRAFALLQELKLEVNPSKCATLYLSGVTPVGSRPTTFVIGGTIMRHLDDAYTYLGKPVGFFLQKNLSD